MSTQDIVEQLLNRGRREGRQEGRQEGLLVGRQEGLLVSRRVLHRVLAERNLVPTEVEAARIEACDDLSTLERWIVEAMTAQSVAEALRPASPRTARRAATRPAARRRKSATAG